MTARVAFVFPGQGSQTVGMGADIFAASAAARRVFEAVDQALGFSLSDVCFHGPEDSLRETINAQPAIVTVSLALLAALQESLSLSLHTSSWSSPLVPSYTAGHSVGEYAAVVVAGALDLGSAALLVRERGRLMHYEGTVCAGGMAAVIGMDSESLQAVCQEATAQALASLATESTMHLGQGQVSIANFNAPGQIVISGEQRALALAIALAKGRGAKRVIPLAVSGAFHSPVMQPATSGLVAAIQAANVRDTAVAIIGNVDAMPLVGAQAIGAELAQQIASPVQWVRSIEYLASVGVTHFLEIGPGQALTGMIKRIAKDVTTMSISNWREIENAMSMLREMGVPLEV